MGAEFEGVTEQNIIGSEEKIIIIKKGHFKLLKMLFMGSNTVLFREAE